MKKWKAPLASIGLVVFALIMTGCFGLFGPKVGDVSGKITWDDGSNVVGAEVKAGGKTDTTGTAGTYKLTGIAHGPHTLTVTVDGKQLASENVTIGKTPAVKNIEITKDTEDPDPDPDPDPPIEGFCGEVPDYAAGMTLAYCQDFAESDNFEDYDFKVNGAGAWTIVEDDDKHWVSGDIASGWTTVYTPVDGLGPAAKVIVEYTIKPTRATHYALMFKASNESSNQGGNSYFSFDYSGFYALRVMEGNTHGDRNYSVADGKGVVGEAKQMRLVLENGKINVFMNGEALGEPFPVDLGERLYTDAENELLGLYLSGSAAQWTDIRIWVD